MDMLAENTTSDAYASVEGQGRDLRRKEIDSYVPAQAVEASSLVLPGPSMQLRSQLVSNERCYSLNDFFVIEFEFGEDEVFASHRSLPVHGNGSTQQDALESFCSAFDFQWRNLVEVPVESLTLGGKKLRELMERAVASVRDLEA